jgi:hypothetical protein
MAPAVRNENVQFINGGFFLETRIPLNTPPLTTLETVFVEVEEGFGPASFTLLEGGQVASINQQGQIILTEQLTQLQTLRIVVQISDARENCIVRRPTGTLTLKDGPCTTNVLVEVQTLVFLNCPMDINVYVRLNETNAAVGWPAPRLPDSLGDLLIFRELGDTESSQAPFSYGVGSRTVRYETEPLSSVNVGIVCEFEVNVRTGFNVPVENIARVATPLAVQEFILVDQGSSSDGAKLPTFAGPLEGRTLSVGIRSPPGKPFSIAPGVSLGKPGSAQSSARR